MHLGQNERKDNIIDVLLKDSKKGNRAVWNQQNPKAANAQCEQNVRRNL